jgi:signal transduction histidine kinase
MGDVDSARQLRDKKRALAALVVHELRSPLSAVQGYLSLLRDELDPNAVTPVVKTYLDDAETLVQPAQ